MTWFKVDDKLHSNNKVRKVLADDPAALALWVVAGSWSSDNLTNGLIPDHQLPWLLPKGAEELAQKLVAAGLWRRVRGGHLFHQWEADGDGTKRNPTRDEVENERRKKAEAGRKGGLASGKTRSKREARASASGSARARAPADVVVEPPTRPSPSKEGERVGDRPALRTGAAGPDPGRHAPSYGPEDPRVIAEEQQRLIDFAADRERELAEFAERTVAGSQRVRDELARRRAERASPPAP